MIHNAMRHKSMMLAVAAGLVVAGGAPVKADFFKDVERAFVGTYEDARDGAKGLVKDTNQAVNGPDQSGSNVATTTPYAPASATGNVAAEVQTELTMAGYNPGPADGVAGPRTAAAVRAYQADNGLPADGQVSQPLLDHLRSKRLSAYNTGTGQPATAAPSGYAPAPDPARPGPTQPQMPAPVAAPPPAPVVQQTQPQQTLPQLPGAVAPPPQQAQQNCKPYEKRTVIEGRETVSTGTACLQADGSWKPIN